MPGYKIVLIIVLSLSILGGIGYGIYFLVTGGGDDSRSTFNAYTNVSKSSENIYINENLGATDLAQYFDGEFDNYYALYVNEKLFFDEMSENLYFAQGRAEGKQELEAKIYNFGENIKATYANLKYLKDAELSFKTENSESGTLISTNEINQLKELALTVKDDFIVQTNTLNEINNLLYPFVVNSCLGGDMKTSLKYNILFVMLEQSNLLYSNLSTKTVTQIVLDDNQKVISVYKNEKDVNFVSSVAGSSALNFVLALNWLDDDIKSGFFNAENKQSYLTTQGPNVITNLNYIINYFGFGGA